MKFGIIACLFIICTLELHANAEQAHGCSEEYFVIECSPTSVIQLVAAWHGQFSLPCGEGQCCNPNEAVDCIELMAEHDPQDWDQLKQKCNYLPICTVYNHGGMVVSCAEPYTADYALVQYVCVGIPADAEGQEIKSNGTAYIGRH